MAWAERVFGGDSASRESGEGCGREGRCGAGRVQPVQLAGGDGGLRESVRGARRWDSCLQPVGSGHDERAVRLHRDAVRSFSSCFC